ncbi:hypothetical protein ACFL1R_06745 [Candidatus Latescibacterota bacterium]
MNTKNNFLMIVLMLLAGLIGGIASSWIFNTLKYERLTTKHLQIVDNNGNVRIKLYASPIKASPIKDDYQGSEGYANIELFNKNGSLFSLWCSGTQSLTFCDPVNANQQLSLGPKLLEISDGKTGSRLSLGYISRQKTREKYELEPYSFVVFNEDQEVVWKAPSLLKFKEVIRPEPYKKSIESTNN